MDTISLWRLNKYINIWDQHKLYNFGKLTTMIFQWKCYSCKLKVLLLHIGSVTLANPKWYSCKPEVILLQTRSDTPAKRKWYSCKSEVILLQIWSDTPANLKWYSFKIPFLTMNYILYTIKSDLLFFREIKRSRMRL